ncbi:hypothetical protein [Rhizobium dioscoreae]|uniref:hypothetical protein n=1 Tax=Rhizobium TaxID=379 RepID=UPI0012610C0B|nr:MULTISPECIES: hypothetical protein [Rhizobium]
MTGIPDEDSTLDHSRKLPAVTRQNQQASLQEDGTGRPPEVPAEVSHASHLSTTIINQRPNMAKWQVLNSVALPPRVTEREVFALATILNRSSWSKF